MFDTRLLKRMVRRSAALAICLSPVVLVLTSLATSIFGPNKPPFSMVGFVIAALLIAALNVCLSFIRPILLMRRYGSLDGIRHISGIPLVGNILVMLGMLLGFGSLGSTLLGLLAIAIDIGGLPWLLVAIWRDTEFWSAP